MKLILLAFLTLVTACKDTQADSDAGLYDPVPPAGAAFVRFANISGEKLSPSLKKKKYDDVASMSVSPYYVFKKGSVALTLNDETVEASLEGGGFYTVTTNTLITDQANANRAKAVIAFYNLSDKPDLTLKAKDGTISVLKDVSAQSMDAREMNATKIGFGVYEGDKPLKSIADMVIERGNHYSLIYTGDALLFVTAETDTRS